MKKLLFIIIFLASAICSFGQILGLDTLLSSGSNSNRISIVILPDGYTSKQLAREDSDGAKITRAIFSQFPESDYKNHCNVVVVRTASVDSGIKQPSTCGPLLSPNIYYGSTFGVGVCRGIGGNSTTINNTLLKYTPYYDIVILMVNSPLYGGLSDGSTIGFTMGNTAYAEIILHELGHTLAGLTDEYAYGGCGYPAGWNGLSTHDTAYARTLWGDTWVPWLPGDGLYNGADYCPQGLRDSVDCKMNHLNQPYCPQCKKRFIASFNIFVNPIDGFTPASTATSTTGFTAAILQPKKNTVNVLWYANGILKQKGRNTFTPLPAAYTSVKVTAQDTSKWLFKTAAKLYSQQWNNITVTGVTPPPCKPKHQIRTLTCQAGYAGTWIQTRDSLCSTGSWTAWKDSINTCTLIPAPTGLVTINGATVWVGCNQVAGGVTYSFTLNTGQVISTTGTEAGFTNLKAKATYTVTVTVTTSTGTSAPSAPLTFTTP